MGDVLKNQSPLIPECSFSRSTTDKRQLYSSTLLLVAFTNFPMKAHGHWPG